VTGKTISVTAKDFRAQVLDSDEPVLVAFRASWCVPSQQMTSVVDSLAEKYNGRARMVSVEVGPETERLARSFNVTRLPVVMVFKDGQPKDFIGGFTDEANVAEMIETQLKPVIDLSEHNFEMEVIRSRVPVLVHFFAAACKPSTKMEQVINEVAAKFHRRANVARLEMLPENARLFAMYNVKRVPTTAVFYNGTIQDQIFGAMVGGTKIGNVQSSCVGLTSFDNLGEMLGRFVM
jgi:thioredoxin 1